MPEPDTPENSAIASAVREELARRRMSRATLAAEARISLSSLEKALAGQRPFTDATVIRLEEALGKKLRQTSPAEVAPPTLGSYARAAVSWLEGDYLTLRPSGSDPSALYAYRTAIRWDHEKSHLVFSESERLDSAFTQKGDVSIPHQSGHIYLITNRHGQHRLAILARPTIDDEIHGLLTTLQQGRGAQLTPIAMPIVLVKRSRLGEDAATGKIGETHGCYRDYRTRLDRTLSDGFATLLGMNRLP